MVAGAHAQAARRFLLLTAADQALLQVGARMPPGRVPSLGCLRMEGCAKCFEDVRSELGEISVVEFDGKRATKHNKH